jgi:hypothetical protein
VEDAQDEHGIDIVPSDTTNLAALKTVAARVQYTELPGVDHNDAGVKVFADAATLSWLVSQHR